MAVTVRKAVADDLAAMTDISVRSKQSNGYDDAFMAACVEELTVTEALLVARDYWVADLDGVRGLAALEALPDEAVGEVHAFFVDPDMKRKGIGRALWDVLLTHAHGAGMKTLYLDADPSAVPFYEAMGFDVFGQSPSGSISGRFLPRMRLDLSKDRVSANGVDP